MLQDLTCDPDRDALKLAIAEAKLSKARAYIRDLESQMNTRFAELAAARQTILAQDKRIAELEDTMDAIHGLTRPDSVRIGRVRPPSSVAPAPSNVGPAPSNVGPAPPPVISPSPSGRGQGEGPSSPTSPTPGASSSA